MKNMKGKSFGVLALTLLLTSNNEMSNLNTVQGFKLEHKLSEAAVAWNSLHSHSHSHSHHKKKEHKKKKSHKSKHKHEEEEQAESNEESQQNNTTTEDDASKKKAAVDVTNVQNASEDGNEENSEAAKISSKASSGLQNLQADDASLQDIY